MAKYHITDNGPAPCSVVTGTCPYGGEHFALKADATKAYEEIMKSSDPLRSRRPNPAIARVSKALAFETNPGLTPEELDERMEEIAATRAELEEKFIALEAKGFLATPEELEALNRDREAAKAKVLELLERHENEVLELKKAHQAVSTLNKEADTALEFDYDEMIPLYEKVRNREEYKGLLRAAMDQAKDNHAILVAMDSEAHVALLRERGEFPELDLQELRDAEGNLVGTVTADHPVGSAEWQLERNKGIGGSDVGKAIGVSNVARKPALPEADGTWRELDDVKRYPKGGAPELINDKISVREVENDHRSQSGAARFTEANGRGDAWETAILLRQMEEHPGEVAFCKSSFASVDHPDMRYNFDGLLLDKETGRPNGALEIKTASHADHWGNPADGLDGVPDNYRAQTLHYALNAGFDRGRVAVVINDHDYRTYDFDFTQSPELKEEAEANRVKAQEAMDKVHELRAAGETSFAKAGRTRGAFTVAQLKPSDLASKKRIFETAAAYRGVTPAQVKKEYVAARAKGLETKEEQTAALRGLFTQVGEKDKRPVNLVGIDLETSGLTPGRGRILDLGIETVESGKRTKVTDETYGVGPYARRHKGGVGYEDLRNVHNISTEMIAHQEPFKASPDLVSRLTKKGTVLMAHNAIFEKQWLSSYVPGFNNALRRGDIKVIDSKDLSQWLDDTPGNSMNHYGHRWGVYSSLDGEEEHRAYADARDMVDAYTAQRRALRGEGN